MTDIALRSLAWNAPSTWITIAAAVVLGGLGVRAVIDPVAASALFGVALEGGDGVAFVRAMGGRNLGLALTGLALVALDLRLGLAVLLASAALMAGVDAFAVGVQAGLGHAAKHLGYVAGLGGLAAWIGLGR